MKRCINSCQLASPKEVGGLVLNCSHALILIRVHQQLPSGLKNFVGGSMVAKRFKSLPCPERRPKTASPRPWSWTRSSPSRWRWRRVWRPTAGSPAPSSTGRGAPPAAAEWSATRTKSWSSRSSRWPAWKRFRSKMRLDKSGHLVRHLAKGVLEACKQSSGWVRLSPKWLDKAVKNNESLWA